MLEVSQEKYAYQHAREYVNKLREENPSLSVEYYQMEYCLTDIFRTLKIYHPEAFESVIKQLKI